MQTVPSIKAGNGSMHRTTEVWGVWLMAGELRGFDRSALLPPEDLVEHVGTGQLYALFDPELEAPEVTRLHSEDQGCVWVYSSVDLLIESCGDGQPYVALTASQVVELATAVDGMLLAALDVWHPEGARYPEPDPQEFAPLEPIATDSMNDSLVWIPTRPVRSGDRDVSAELYGRRPGEKLLLLFDSQEQAWEACGPYQALSAVRLDDLDAVVRASGADGVVAGNGMVSEEARHTGPVQDWLRDSRDRFFM